MTDRLAAPLPRLMIACSLATLASTAAHADDARVLPTVIVTGQKMAQTLEQVPASVSSIDGDFMREIGVKNIDTMQNYSANISINVTSSAGQANIRGLGTNNSNQASDPSVGTVIDGVFYGRTSFAAAFIDDIDRFEVLRGPQGTLFGKNSTAGLINIVTRAPEDEPSARVEVNTSGTDSRTYRPMFNLPLMEGVAVRFSGNYSVSDGVLYNTFLKRDERDPHLYTSRLRISVEPVEGWRGDIEGFTSTQFENFNIFKIVSASAAMQQLIKDRDPDFVLDKNSKNNSSNIPSKEAGVISGANLTISHDMSGTFDIHNLQLTSITAYGEQFTKARDLDADFTPVAFIRDSLIQPSPYRQFSQEVRFSGNHPTLLGWGEGFSFVTGLYYFDSSLKTSDKFEIQDLSEAAAYEGAANGDSIPAPLRDVIYRASPLLGDTLAAAQALGIHTGQAAMVRLNQTDKAYAVFGQFEHMFLPEWSLIGGARYGFEKKNGLASSESNGLPVISQLPQPLQDALLQNAASTAVISQITGKPASCGVSIISLIADQCNHVTPITINESDFSPKLGVKWTPNKVTSAYATFSRGFKSGGFNALPLSPDNLAFKAERATSYEIGAKTRLMNGSMNVSASAFSTDFDNLQISSFQNNSFVILNAAAARSRGFEVDTRWLPPIQGLSLNGSMGFADARYKSYPNAPAPAGSSQSTQDLTGKRLAFAPRWTASLVPSYSQNIDQLGLVSTVAVDLLYRGDRYLDVDDDDRKLQPANTIINARMILGRPDDSWSVNVAAQNITNQLIYDQIVGQPLAPGNFAGTRTDRGRFYTASLTMNFQ